MLQTIFHNVLSHVLELLNMQLSFHLYFENSHDMVIYIQWKKSL